HRLVRSASYVRKARTVGGTTQRQGDEDRPAAPDLRWLWGAGVRVAARREVSEDRQGREKATGEIAPGRAPDRTAQSRGATCRSSWNEKHVFDPGSLFTVSTPPIAETSFLQ